MKYVIIGAGGTGGAIAAYLGHYSNQLGSDNAPDVTVIARGAHLAAMKEKGLIIHSAKLGNQTVKMKCCTMEEYNDTPDVILNCVKYYSLQDTIDFVNRVATKDTLVIPILNVFGTGGTMQSKLKNAVALDGCIYIFSMIEAPGVIKHPTEIFRIFFGFRKGQRQELIASGLSPEKYEKIAKQAEADLSASGIDAKLTDTIEKDALKKFSFVSPMGAASLYYSGTGKDFQVPGPKQDTFFALVREVEALGNAMGITYDEDLIEINRKIMMDLTPDSTTSMQRDIAAGKDSEIDGLVHRIVRLADEYGIDLPTYRMISEWAKGM